MRAHCLLFQHEKTQLGLIEVTKLPRLNPFPVCRPLNSAAVGPARQKIMVLTYTPWWINWTFFICVLMGTIKTMVFMLFSVGNNEFVLFLKIKKPLMGIEYY